MKFKHKKELGQNFLKSDFYVEKIIDSLRVNYSPGNLIFEIASGAGALTNKLVEYFPQAKIYAVDLDPQALALIPGASNLFKLNQDILSFDFQKLEEENPEAQILIVGNLPFQIGTKIFLQLIGEISQAGWSVKNIKAMTLMFQKEVAQRITAKPDQKAYNRLSIVSELKTKAEYLFDVPRKCFEPEPKVEAGVIKIFPQEHQEFSKLSKKEKEFFEKLVKTAFLYKRKKLSNSLGFLFKRELLEKVGASIDLNLRPENLSVEDFIKITRISL